MARPSTLPPLPTWDAPPLPARARRRRDRAPWWRPRIPWTVHRYLVGEYARITILGVLAVSLVYTTFAAYQTVKSGLQLNFIWPLLLKTFASPLYYSLPISFLYAITLAMGRLGTDLEVMALRTHGVSYRQIYAPAIALGTVMACVAFYLNGWVVPDIHFEKRNLQTYILNQLENLGSGMNRTILLPDDEGSLWVESYKGTDLYRVRVDFKAGKGSSMLPAIREHLPSQLPNSVRIIANRGTIEVQPDRRSVLLSLSSVQILVAEPVKNASVANEVFHQPIAITGNVRIPLSFAPKRPGIKDRSNPELLEYIASLQETARPPALNEDEDNLQFATYPTSERAERTASRVASAKTEFHRRIAFTLSSIAFALLGVSLSLHLDRWGRLVPFFAANLILVAAFYPLMILGVYLGERGLWAPLSMALPNVALLAMGIHLTRKVVKR